jgi:hypothetical protein
VDSEAPSAFRSTYRPPHTLACCCVEKLVGGRAAVALLVARLLALVSAPPLFSVALLRFPSAAVDGRCSFCSACGLDAPSPSCPPPPAPRFVLLRASSESPLLLLRARPLLRLLLLRAKLLELLLELLLASSSWRGTTLALLGVPAFLGDCHTRDRIVESLNRNAGHASDALGRWGDLAFVTGTTDGQSA